MILMGMIEIMILIYILRVLAMLQGMCENHKPILITGIVGGISLVLGIYWYKKYHENLVKRPLQERIIGFQHQLEQTVEDMKRRDSRRPLQKIFELLFKISMQKIVYHNSMSKKRRRTYMKPECLQNDKKLEAYLNVMVEQFLRSKQNAGKFMSEEMEKVKINRDIFEGQSKNPQFIQFKARIRANCLQDLVGIKEMNIVDLIRVLSMQIFFLQQLGEDVIAKIGYAVIGWPNKKKDQLMKTFSLVILDMSLVIMLVRQPKKNDGGMRLSQVDEMDIEYAKRKFEGEREVGQRVQKLENLRKVYSAKLREVLNF